MPTEYTSVKYTELTPATVTDASIIAHDLGGVLKQDTVESLKMFIANYIGASDAIGFYPLTITSGQQLPIPTTQPVFSLVGAGTFLNVNAAPPIVTTEQLNVIVFDADIWYLSVEIPITVDPIEIGITQNITAGIYDLAPSSDAVYNALEVKQDTLTFTPEDTANKQQTPAIDGTGVKYPSLDLFNYFANEILNNLMTSGVAQNADYFTLSDFSNTTLQIGPISGLFFYNEPINSKLKSFPQTDYALSNISMPVSTKRYLYVAYDALGAVHTSQVNYINDNNYAGLGTILVKSSATGVVTFLDTAPSPRNVRTRPDIAGYNHLLRKIAGMTSTITPLPNGNMTMYHDGGNVVGMSVNWGGTDPDERQVVAANPFSFSRINPNSLTNDVVNPNVTTLVVSDYWNGTAVVPLTGVNNASVQRVIVSSNGQLVVQMGELQYATYQDAKDGVSTAPFTSILPEDNYIEICRIVAVKNATDLSNIDQAQFVMSGAGGGSGSGGGGSTVVNLGYTPSTTQGTVTNDSGTSSTLPVVDATKAGLMTPTQRQTLIDTAGIIKSANFTAENDKRYNIAGSVTVTDPISPITGHGYICYVVNGTAIINGISYGVGSLVYRYYYGVTWSSSLINVANVITMTEMETTVLQSNWIADSGTFINTILEPTLDGEDTVDVIYNDLPSKIKGIGFNSNIESGLGSFDIRADKIPTADFTVMVRIIKNIIY